MQKSLEPNLSTFKQTSGFFELKDWGVIEVAGPDAADYLQRMSTVNIKKLAMDEQVPGAFLTGKGTVISLGTFLKKTNQTFWLCVSPQQIEKTLQHLDQFHFQEKLEVKDRSSEFSVLGIIRADGIYEDRIVPRNELEKTHSQLSQEGLSFLSMDLYHFYRILRGIPWVGWEVGDTDLILEASMDQAVARNKGCYPGQEVVERIFTYGQVNRKLVTVELSVPVSVNLPETPLEFKKGDAPVGKLMSAVQVPNDSGKAVGLAYIKKGFWESDETFSLNAGITLKLC